MKKKIGIIFGGQSSEYEISCISAANVAENVDKSLFDVMLIGITRDGKWWIYEGGVDKMRDATWDKDRSLLRPAVISPCSAHHGVLALDAVRGGFEAIRLDAVFPVLHGRNGEDGRMQGLLALSGIPYVGCDTCASAVGMDKAFTKTIAASAGVKVVPFVDALSKEDRSVVADRAEKAFSYPMFVKPANAGSSVGITKAKNRGELLAGLETAFANDRKILIEPAVAGREIEVAVCGNDDPVVSVCGEIIPHSEFYDYETKYVSDCAECLVPADITKEESDSIRDAAAKVWLALGCSGLSRVDFFLLPDGTGLLNEINTIPGFTSISMYPRLMGEVGVGYGELITELIRYATERSER